ncbi:uncharacterized protein LOC144425889 [Styela clava]
MFDAQIIDGKLYRAILPKDPKPARLRLQPKVHKQNHPSRPITSGNGSATEKLSAFVDYQLTPLMNTNYIPSYIKDTTDFLNKIQRIAHFSNSSGGSLLVTMDVVSLYTNIPHTEGVRALRKMLEKKRTDPKMIYWITKAAECVLTNNNLEFDNCHYLQIQGTAMGTKMAPKYACCFMAILEEEILEKSPLKPLTYLRFIDDCKLIWTSGLENLQKFIKFANSFHSSIKFTFEHSQTKLPYMGTMVHIIDNKLETKLYSKPTDTHQYLLPSSCHPKQIHRNIPPGLAIRIRRICSNLDFFNKHSENSNNI